MFGSRRTRVWVAVTGGACALVLAGQLWQPVIVQGRSMEPTLTHGQLIWVDRLAYRLQPPRRGEVLVFRLGGETMVKRVYRGPGKVLYFSGTPADTMTPIRASLVPRLVQNRERGSRLRLLKSTRLADDRVFVVGDNPPLSEDSRQYGPIPTSCILGRARVPADQRRLLECEISYKRRRNPPPRPPGVRAARPSGAAGMAGSRVP